MTKILLLLFAVGALAMPATADAKYNPPPEKRATQAQKTAIGEINRLDIDGDGKLSPEEFGAKVNSYTRTEEKNARRARKKGIYQSPETQFANADKDGDGFLSFGELSAYIAEYQKLDKGRARYY